LREAVEEYGQETAKQEQPLDHFVEWLVEWCRTVRHRQTGLLLLSAHRAKGLEFDHVAVLDGEWQQRSCGEDPDAPRRLYYVAMTRARQSLLLARMLGRGHMLEGVEEGAGVVFRDAPPSEPIPAELYRVRRRLSPKEVDLGFAGRYARGHKVHVSIARLSAGDRLELRQRDGKWALHDLAGNVVGRLANAFTPPAGMRCIGAAVAAVLTRFEDDGRLDYRDQLRGPRWEVVIPEFKFGLRYSLEQLGGEGLPLGIVGIELATAFDQLLLSEEGGFQ
jgi:ATP-dependent DNA helicase RecQ